MDVKKSHSSNSRDFIAEANSIIANIFHGIENKKEVQLNSTVNDSDLKLVAVSVVKSVLNGILL